MTSENILAFIAGMFVAFLYVKLMEHTGRTSDDDSNVDSVHEDVAQPLRALFDEPDNIAPPEVVPAKRGPGRPRKMVSGTALGPSWAEPDQPVIPARAPRKRRTSKPN